MKRYQVTYIRGMFCVLDTKTDTVRIECTTLSEAKAHARGLNR